MFGDGYAEMLRAETTMAGMAPDPELGQDMEEMINDEVKQRVGRNSTVLVAVNFGLLVIIAVWVGIYIQQISDLRSKVSNLESVAVLSTKIDVLTQEVNRLRDELDRLSRRYQENSTGRAENATR